MEMSDKTSLERETSSAGIQYLRSLPGIPRVVNLIFGLISLILVLPGFGSDFSPNIYEEKDEQRKRPWYTLSGDDYYYYADTSYYGAGYSEVGLNVAQLVCICVPLVFSAFLLLTLVNSQSCHEENRGRGFNRFFHLAAGIVEGVGFLNGVFGLLLFRSYCCHVEFTGSERHHSEMEGYRESCLCYYTPTFRDSGGEHGAEHYSLHYNDVADDTIFHTIFPHHFIPRAIALILMALNTVAYLVAAVKI